MSASELQQKRTKTYFIEAAKEILRGEGLKVANARNIAERAGYSYATLYNYFKDLTSLIFECVRDFQIEIETLISPSINAADSGDAKLRAGLTGWINYFVQYPGIFELFFLEKIGETGNRSDIADTIYNSIIPACRPALNKWVEDGLISKEEAVRKQEILRFQITGLLLYYANRKNPADYTGLMQTLNLMIDEICS